MFRVVQDQLKICNGIVRCGSCRQVFNGIEQLQSADAATQAMREQAREQVREQAKQQATWPESAIANPNPVTIMADEPPPTMTRPGAPKPGAQEKQDDLNLILTPTDASTLGRMSVSERVDPLFVNTTPMRLTPVEDERLNLDLHYDSRQEPSLADEMRADAQRERDFTEELTFPRTQLPVVEEAQQDFAIEPDDNDPAYTVEIRPQLSQVAEPAFVQRAKQQERYGRMGRLAMWGLILGLLPALLLQTVDAFHLRIAGFFPSTRPLLAQICDVIECRAELPAHIDSVSIDSYELHSPTKGGKAYTLNVLLRNRSTMAQAWPHFELTLKDSTETPMVRRVFSAKEYLNGTQNLSKGFAANSEHPIKLQFEVEPPLKPVGYEVYLFYV